MKGLCKMLFWILIFVQIILIPRWSKLNSGGNIVIENMHIGHFILLFLLKHPSPTSYNIVISSSSLKRPTRGWHNGQAQITCKIHECQGVQGWFDILNRCIIMHGQWRWYVEYDGVWGPLDLGVGQRQISANFHSLLDPTRDTPCIHRHMGGGRWARDTLWRVRDTLTPQRVKIIST